MSYIDKFFKLAVEEAIKGLNEGGIPVGSVLVHDQIVLGKGHNRRLQDGSVILHAEMDALENAGRLTENIYSECSLYTTLSPCVMCSGAILLYKIPRVIVGENKNFKGEEELLKSRGVRINVLQDPDCIKIMSDYIAANPKLWQEDIGIS